MVGGPQHIADVVTHLVCGGLVRRELDIFLLLNIEDVRFGLAVTALAKRSQHLLW